MEGLSGITNGTGDEKGWGSKTVNSLWVKKINFCLLVIGLDNSNTLNNLNSRMDFDKFESFSFSS